MDETTPIGAEITEHSCETVSFYGTSTPKTPKNSHIGLIIALCLGVMLLCTAHLLVTLLGLRLVRTEDGLRLHIGYPAETETVQSDPASIQAGTQADDLEHDAPVLVPAAPSDSQLSTAEQYALLSPAVVRLQAVFYETTAESTGVIFTQSGYLLSGGGDLTRALEVRCTLSDGRVYPAAYLGTDTQTGFSLLKLSAADLTAAQFGSAAQTRVGEPVISIGNPSGSPLSNVLQEGVLTAIGSDSNGMLTLLQSSAASEGGGCPIIDGSGQIIGLTLPISAVSDNGVLALSSDDLPAVLARILQKNAAVSLWLGFDVGEIPPLLVSYYRFPGTLWIRGVADARIDEAGLYDYDVILQADGQTVTTWEEFNAALAAHAPGERIELLIYRDGSLYNASVLVRNR